MFTGIIRDIGTVVDRNDHGVDRRFTFAADSLDCSALPIGASISVNGVCLTVIAVDGLRFDADVSHETLAVTTFGALQLGSRVNLEPSLRIGDSLDGHWVTGHVDGVGQIAAKDEIGRAVELTINVAPAVNRYIARKGSIAVDGCSLTVNSVSERGFGVAIIPHTQSVTVIDEYIVGTAVNIEVDIVARYIERLSAGESRSK